MNPAAAAGGGRRAQAAGLGGLRDVTMAVAMVELCEGARLPLLAAPLLGSLLPGAPQPGPAQPRFVQGQRCPAGYPPGDLGEEPGPSPGGRAVGGPGLRRHEAPGEGVGPRDQVPGVLRSWKSGPFQASEGPGWSPAGRLQSGQGFLAATSQEERLRLGGGLSLGGETPESAH